jgi:hypothetical protein
MGKKEYPKIKSFDTRHQRALSETGDQHMTERTQLAVNVPGSDQTSRAPKRDANNTSKRKSDRDGKEDPAKKRRAPAKLIVEKLTGKSDKSAAQPETDV